MVSYQIFGMNETVIWGFLSFKGKMTLDGFFFLQTDMFLPNIL